MKNILHLVLGLALFILLSSCGYNTFQRQDEAVKSSWAEVLNQYKRRADLIPNLVKVVKGYADHEEEVFTSVAEARSRVANLNVSDDILSDEEAFARFQAAQASVGSALSRLLAVAENYPNLKADASFRELQAQLEGTENRITVARKRYIDSVKEFNVTVRSFPSNLTAMVFGYETKPTFAVENEAALATPPEVNF